MIIGTYHGGISHEHLDYYLDEFTFRFNRRTARSRGLLFYRLLEGAVQTGHTTTQALFGGAKTPMPEVPMAPLHLRCGISLCRVFGVV